MPEYKIEIKLHNGDIKYYETNEYDMDSFALRMFWNNHYEDKYKNDSTIYEIAYPLNNIETITIHRD